MMAQSALIASYSSFGECTTATTIELANRVAGLAPNPDSKVFFTLGGSDAIDTAIKMARRYWTLREQPRKQVILFRDNGYHGMNVGGTSIAGIGPNNDGLGDLVTNVVQVSWDDADEVIAFCRERLAHYKCPTMVVFTELPKTSTGKIQKFVLREQASKL